MGTVKRSATATQSASESRGHKGVPTATKRVGKSGVQKPDFEQLIDQRAEYQISTDLRYRLMTCLSRRKTPMTDPLRAAFMTAALQVVLYFKALPPQSSSEAEKKHSIEEVQGAIASMKDALSELSRDMMVTLNLRLLDLCIEDSRESGFPDMARTLHMSSRSPGGGGLLSVLWDVLEGVDLAARRGLLAIDPKRGETVCNSVSRDFVCAVTWCYWQLFTARPPITRGSWFPCFVNELGRDAFDMDIGPDLVRSAVDRVIPKETEKEKPLPQHQKNRVGFLINTK
jgi:hypothetical protein